MMSPRQTALNLLSMTDPFEKAHAVIQWLPESDWCVSDQLQEPLTGLPGRPDRPELVPPWDVKQRSLHTQEGRATLIHALAHIEFNAINLALDAIWRFCNQPVDFYQEWLIVAKDEARHFLLLSDHLRTMGFEYGDFSAHQGLWDMAERTRHDVLARMALVPRTLEARGLDASPGIRDKLRQVGDLAGADILEIILNDEITHVAIGNRWYRYHCERQGKDPIALYDDLASLYKAPAIKGVLNREARLAAGFLPEELDRLTS